MPQKIKTVLAAIAVVTMLAGCVTANDQAMKLGVAPDGAVALRELQTRQLPATDEVALLVSATQTLQDLGFTLSSSATEVGVLAAQKQRDAEEAGQVAGQMAMTIVLALLGTAHNPVWDKEQIIHVTLATRPLPGTGEMELRVSFQRRLLNNHGQWWRAEILNQPEIYSEFFDKLRAGLHLDGAAS